MNKELDLGRWDIALVGDGSLRPFVTQLVLGALPDRLRPPMQDQYELEEAAIYLDPLWRQTMAVLSTGPTDFGRFEAERVRFAVFVWPRLFSAMLKKLLESKGAKTARIEFCDIKSITELAGIEGLNVSLRPLSARRGER